LRTIYEGILGPTIPIYNEIKRKEIAIKSFKQYLKEYASAVLNEEDDIEENDTEESEDEELAVALTRSGEGGQALRNAMQQDGLLRLKTRLYPEDEQGSYEDIRDRVARGIASSEDLREFGNLLIKRAKLDPSVDPPSETDQTYTPVPSYKTVPPETDNTKGKDQEMLDTIAGRGDSLDRPIQRDAGSALLSAMRAGGMTFDAKWPSNVDRYDNREKDAGRMRPVSTERR